MNLLKWLGFDTDNETEIEIRQIAREESLNADALMSEVEEMAKTTVFPKPMPFVTPSGRIMFLPSDGAEPQPVQSTDSGAWFPDYEPTTIGQAVRDARIKAGLRQTDLAKKVFVSDASISMLERDKQYPYCHLLKKIAKALNTPITFTITPE